MTEFGSQPGMESWAQWRAPGAGAGAQFEKPALPPRPEPNPPPSGPPREEGVPTM
jgi:hypothetical protein